MIELHIAYAVGGFVLGWIGSEIYRFNKTKKGNRWH